MIRTFVLSLTIVSLLAGLAAADVPQKNTQTKSPTMKLVLYRPEKDKVIIINPVYRPGTDKLKIIHPIYRPGIDKYKVRTLIGPASHAFPKQTTSTLTSNISEGSLRSRATTEAKVPAAKSERGSLRCGAKKGQCSLM